MSAPPPADARQAQSLSLSDAMASTFRLGQADKDFATGIAHFGRALCDAQAAFVVSSTASDAPTDLVSGGHLPEDAARLAQALHDGTGPGIAAEAASLAARIAFPDGARGVLVLQFARADGMLLSLAHERLTILSHHSFARFNDQAARVRRTLADAVQGRNHGAIADALAATTEADFVAIGRWDGHEIRDLAVSGQGEISNRSILPETLVPRLRDAIEKGIGGPATTFIKDRTGDTGLALHIEGASLKPAELNLLLHGVGDQLAGADVSPRKAPWRRRALIAALLLGAALVPLPDGVSIPATLAASEARIVTAPLSAVLDQVNVRHSDQVSAGETVLAEMDTTDTENRLIAAQAEHARAVLERETARTQRNAAELRLAEIEVARLDAEIALHESERNRGTIVAPISGVVIATGLAQQQGTMLRQGDLLLEVADPNTLYLELSIPDEAITDLGTGQVGSFRPDFDPTRKIETEITEVSPSVSELLEVPVFPGRAKLLEDYDGLSPGMTGVVSVRRTWRPAGAIVWKSLRNWFLLKVWP